MDHWLDIVILGLVEGVTEFLPVSSTGHLLLAERWLPRQSDVFNTVIQSGAALAVMANFASRLRALASTRHIPETRSYLGKLALAFGITCAGGLAIKAVHLKLPETSQPVALATALGGVMFVGVERWLTRRQRPNTTLTNLNWTMACAMGGAQLLAAIFPGTSRSGATILLALMMGLSRTEAVDFSFLLGIPTLLAASLVQLVEAMHEPASVPWADLVVGSTVAAVAAFIGVNWLLQFVRQHTFAGFGWYRILLGTLLLFV